MFFSYLTKGMTYILCCSHNAKSPLIDFAKRNVVQEIRGGGSWIPGRKKALRVTRGLLVVFIIQES